MSKLWAGIGSRKTPVDVLKIMIRLGRTLTDLGFVVTSGDAFGADRGFIYGARQSEKFKEVGAKVYLIKDGFRGRRADGVTFIDVSKFKDNEKKLLSMVEEARGTLLGLNETGLALHSRNVYQIHGTDLSDVVKGVFFYSESINDAKVKGGTNTAFQLALKAKVKYIKNLYLKEDLDWCLNWLEKYETSEPYEAIDWDQILDTSVDYKPANDGIDHINIYSKSKNRLGYLLSNWGESTFIHPRFGLFKTIEGFYAYLASEEKYDYLRTSNPYEAKKILEGIDEKIKEQYHDEVKQALVYKFEQSKEIAKLFELNPTLPFTHYYYYGGLVNPKVIPNKKEKWLENAWSKIRTDYLTNLTLEKAKAGNL